MLLLLCSHEKPGFGLVLSGWLVPKHIQAEQ